MSDCVPRAMLVAYERGELNDTDGRPVERHLRRCPKCMQVMNELRLTDPDGQMLRKVFAQTSESLTPDGEASAAAVAPQPHEAGTPAEAGSSQSGSSARGGARLTGPPAPTDWRVPDYERVQLCGEGSYGAVWAVRDRVGVFRALKIIDLDRLERANITCHELPALESYCRKVPRHAHLITVFHVGQVEQCLYYTMELADDQRGHGPVHDEFPKNYRPLTLSTLINVGRISVDVSMELAIRVLRGLARLHELHLIHRDVKPSNVVFVNRQPKLADIGVLTGEGQRRRIVGTPKYMPPDRVMDKSADTFAIGKVLHEMIMGKDAPSFPDVPDDERWIGAKWNRNRVAALIRRACAADARDRYPDAAMMLADAEASAQAGDVSLFDQITDEEPPPSNKIPAHVLVELGFAFADRLPWIIGGAVALFLIYKFL